MTYDPFFWQAARAYVKRTSIYSTAELGQLSFASSGMGNVDDYLASTQVRSHGHH